MTKPKQADRFSLFLEGGISLAVASRECGMHRVVLSSLRTGAIIPTVDQIGAIAKWTGRTRGEVVKALTARNEARIAALLEAIA